MIATLILAILVIYLVYSWLNGKPKNFPPGPPCLPLIGNILHMPKELVHMVLFKDWLKKYGPIVGLMLGSRQAFAVIGPKEVLEVLKREEFQGRPDNEFFRERSFNKRLGVFFSDGPFWVEQRRFTLRHLRDFGFGKKNMENIIVEEAEDLIRDLSSKDIVQVSGLFTISVLNVLWTMMGGVRYARDDIELQALLERLTRIFRTGNPTGGRVATMPILKRIAPVMSGHQENMDNLVAVQEFMRKAIHEHMKTIDESNPRDLIDCYLTEMKKQESNPSSTFTEEGLIMVCLDLFSAGAESVSNTLGFCILYMVLYPEVQEAVQAELDSIVGRHRNPSLEDKTKLPYTEAVLSEIVRVNTIAPVAPPHRCTKETTLNGYTIPKNSTLFINIWSLFHDQEHWGDPDVFRPARFLTPDGKFKKDDWLIAFGAGKRVCLGEVLARNATFLFFAMLLQAFTFRLPAGHPKPTTLCLSGFTTAPRPFKVKIERRN